MDSGVVLPETVDIKMVIRQVLVKLLQILLNPTDISRKEDTGVVLVRVTRQVWVDPKKGSYVEFEKVGDG